MRIRFGNKIYFCTSVTHNKGSNLLLVTTSNGVYTVDMKTSLKANLAYNSLLMDGFYDVSDYEYCN